MIFKLLNKENAYNNFLILLRYIRKWAKRRGIYGNKLGYLGGINCNILVAFICQLYPNLGPFSLLSFFFRKLSKWKWPEPILLNNIQQTADYSTEKDEKRKVWSSASNPYDIMPIITPAYPAMNSTYNVSIHTFKIMTDELERGAKIIEEMLQNNAKKKDESVQTKPNEYFYNEIIKPSDFFVKYTHYLACHIIGTGDNLPSRSWLGFVESRLRRFTLPPFLQTLPIKVPIHLYPMVSKTNKSSNSICYFIGFNIDHKQLESRTDKSIRIDEIAYKFQ